MTKLRAKFILWMNGYCLKHLERKRGIRFVYCEQCSTEWWAKRNRKIELAKETLKTRK